MSLKFILYDWCGLNVALFQAINAGTPAALEPIAWFFSLVGNYWTAPLVMLSLWWWSKSAADPARANAVRLRVTGFGMAFLLALLAATVLKLWLDFPRPPAVLGELVRLIGQAERHYSLPSGHATYSALVVGALWPQVGRRGRIGLVIYAGLVGWSRIASGMHFPADVLAHEIRYGAEGVTKVGDTLWVAIQREWKDDPKGQVKLLGYNLKDKTWSAVRYPLEAAAEGAWNGLSEITAHGDYVYVVERDNQIGLKAALKKLYRVPVSALVGAEIGGELPVVTKEEVRDFIPDLASNNGYVVDKVESFAIDAAGTGYVITDNDGVADSSGETFFWSVGTIQ